jgi:flagellar hook-basal body complex protein FliE
MVFNVGDALAAYKQTANPLSGGAAAKTIGGDSSFGDMLKQIGGDAVETLKAGEAAAKAGAVGKANLTDVVMAVNSAEHILQTIVAIRDRVVQAYQEIIRTSM